MRLRLLALTICLGAWASAPAVGLALSLHSLEHRSGDRDQVVDPYLLSSHGHHHEFDDPAHGHKVVRPVGGPLPALAVLRDDGHRSASTSRRGLLSTPVPTGLPPPQLYTLCAMLL